MVGAAIILGDFIALLASLLTGDPTVNFFLKVTAVLLIVVPIFGYYLWDMRQAEDQVSISVARATPVLRALVIAAVGYSIYVIGTPSQQRDLRLDQQRIGDLRNISNNIYTYLELNEEMPTSLFEMIGPKYHIRSIEDPETGAPYAYRIIDGTDYELCAVFATDSPERQAERRPFSESIWDHGPGRTCFALTIEAKQ